MCSPLQRRRAGSGSASGFFGGHGLKSMSIMDLDMVRYGINPQINVCFQFLRSFYDESRAYLFL